MGHRNTRGPGGKLGRAGKPGLDVIIDWDNPLQTFFTQVFDLTTPEDADADDEACRKMDTN
jgi:hypothetical protein